MKYYLWICVILLLVGLIGLPNWYYTILRIAITGGVIWVLVNEFDDKLTFSVVSFIIIGIYFNPIYPIDIGNRVIWATIEIAAAILFLTKSFISSPATVKK